MPHEITGTVHYHTLTTEGLKPRTVFVWLPPGYSLNETEQYPILYMHDGQNLIDPNTSTNVADWQIDAVAHSLISSHTVRPFIIAGIYHTEDRMKEYNDEPLGLLYRQFVVEVAKPFIDLNYRTLKDAQNTLVGGSSMGGLVSFMLAWEYPNVFSKAICLSPAFSYYHYFDYTKVISADTGPKKTLKFFFYNGGQGLDAEFQPGVDDMVEVLTKKGYKPGAEIFVDIEPTYGHEEADWAKVIDRPLRVFFGSDHGVAPIVPCARAADRSPSFYC